MPEPVSCHSVPGSSVIQCDDIAIGPEPPETQQVEPHEGAAGARALVQSQTPPLVVRTLTADPKDLPLGEIALRCSDEALGQGIAAAAATKMHPALAAVSLLKTSLDLTQCLYDAIDEAQHQSLERQAVELCEENGGRPLSFVDGTFTCGVPIPERVR